MELKFYLHFNQPSHYNGGGGSIDIFAIWLLSWVHITIYRPLNH